MNGRVSIERIKAVVAADYDVPVPMLAAEHRDKKFLDPRHVAIYLACELTPVSRSVVGRLFGGRDHSTIWSAHHKIARLRKSDIRLDGRLLRLERELSPPESRMEVQLAMFIGPLFDMADAA